MENKECCTPGPPAKEHGTVGKEEQCCGMDAYFNWPTGATKAVVMVSDVFGWTKPLLRKFADKIAGEGFVTVVPDYFRGDPIDSPRYPAGPDFPAWIANHPVQGAVEDTFAIIKNLKDKGITSIGIVGFCYGAKVAVLVAKEGGVDSIVLLHPSLLTLDDLKVTKGQLAVLSAELDRPVVVETVEQYKEYLESQNEVEGLVKVFPGVGHGWSVRYDENDEKAVKSAEESHSDTISWLKKYLK